MNYYIMYKTCIIHIIRFVMIDKNMHVVIVLQMYKSLCSQNPVAGSAIHEKLSKNIYTCEKNFFFIFFISILYLETSHALFLWTVFYNVHQLAY